MLRCCRLCERGVEEIYKMRTETKFAIFLGMIYISGVVGVGLYMAQNIFANVMSYFVPVMIGLFHGKMYKLFYKGENK